MNIYFVSLGCDKNLVDSEKMLAKLREKYYYICDEPKEADIIIVNTCAFIHDAKQESIETLLEMAQYKEERCKLLIATGCLAQRYKDDIMTEIPEIDGILGISAIENVSDLIEESFAGDHQTMMKPLEYTPKNFYNRVPSGLIHTRYLKISEGCDKRCTYCAIPMIRGPYRSTPMEELIKEAELLADEGCVELVLVAQETTLYGVDIYGKKMLPELLDKLSQIENIKMIRIMYSYPEEITRELVECVRDNDKICNYFDLPIQHCNDYILKRMGRRTTKEGLVSTIELIRELIPDACLRTTLIAGFPGEDEKMHEECLGFVKAMKFDRLGVFTYSPEENTPAYDFENQVDEETKRRWADEIMEASSGIIFKKNEDMPGKELKVIVDGYVPGDGVYVGRSYKDAYDIDGCVFIETDRELISGSIVKTRISGAAGYDLIAKLY